VIPLSGWVLAVAALVASPALWSSLVEGVMPLDVALTRYLVATAACWVALSLASDLIWPNGTPARGPATDDTDAERPGEQRAEQPR
jgi:hypothetical protein